MLKTKYIFILLFCAFMFVLSFGFYVIVKQSLNISIINQYEQKLKTIDDMLHFSLIDELNTSNISAFAKQTRIDLIILKDNFIISSIDENSSLFGLSNETLKSDESQKLINYFIQNSANMLKKAQIYGNEIFYKSYEFQNYRYILITYPRYSQLYDYGNKALWMLFFCGLIFFILLQIFSKKLRMSFEKILIFLEKIDKKEQILLSSSIFKELNELNQKLYKTKEFLLKKDRQSKKQEAKISLKNTQLSSVISAISHELKNPLSVIDLSLDLIKNDKMADKALKANLLEKISQQSAKLNALTDKLNFVFNLSYQALNKKEFDIFKLCAKIVQNPGFERVKIEGVGAKVFADELLIEQVIINLLSNALKYSQDEVTLSIQGALVCVKDRGKGIAANQITLVTKKFYKIDSASENSFGIGLFLVKKILNMHEVSLIIKSELNKGSEFSFTLNSKELK